MRALSRALPQSTVGPIARKQGFKHIFVGAVPENPAPCWALTPQARHAACIHLLQRQQTCGMCSGMAVMVAVAARLPEGPAEAGLGAPDRLQSAKRVFVEREMRAGCLSIGSRV